MCYIEEIKIKTPLCVDSLELRFKGECVFVCVCVCACVRACVRACVCCFVLFFVTAQLILTSVSNQTSVTISAAALKTDTVWPLCFCS